MQADFGADLFNLEPGWSAEVYEGGFEDEDVSFVSVSNLFSALWVRSPP